MSFEEALGLFELYEFQQCVEKLAKNPMGPREYALYGLAMFKMDSNIAYGFMFVRKALAIGPNDWFVNDSAGYFEILRNNFEEAYRYYEKALELGGSVNEKHISVCAQLGKLEKTRDLRKQLLAEGEHKKIRENWMGLAVSSYRLNDFVSALHVLERLASVEPEVGCNFERSERLLFHAKILIESGQFAQAEQHLIKFESVILDKLELLEYSGRCQIFTGKHSEAVITYRKLIQRNPDNLDYYVLLERAYQLDPSDTNLRLRLYKNLARFYPKAQIPKLVPLMILPEDHREFEALLSEFIQSRYKCRGQFALSFAEPGKIRILEKILKKLPDSDWKFFQLSKILFGENSAKSVEYIDKAIALNAQPDTYYMFKAKILKRQTLMAKAIKQLEEAQKISGGDIYINAKLAKYCLQNNQVDTARDTLNLFKFSGYLSGLADHEVVWYILEEAEAHLRLGQPKLAAEKFSQLLNQWQSFSDSAFKYHSVCLQSGTYRAYIDLLNWKNGLYDNEFIKRVMRGWNLSQS